MVTSRITDLASGLRNRLVDGLRIFFYLLTEAGVVRSLSQSVNRLAKASRATTSIIHGLIVTFHRMWLPLPA